MKFIGRKMELEKLNAEYERDGGFVVIYGRRRVGKTTLIKEFLNNCASHSRYFSDELDAQIFYSKKEHMFTFGTICAKI